MTSEEQMITQERVDSIMDEIEKNSQNVTIKDISTILDVFSYRYYPSDTIIGSFSSSELLDNIDLLLCAVSTLIPYNPEVLEDPNMRSYIFNKIKAASKGLTSKTRKNIFIKNRLSYCDIIGFRRNTGFAKFKFYSDGEKPYLLLAHDYGGGGITNSIEEIVSYIDSLYLNDLGFNIHKDNIEVYYKDIDDYYLSVKLDENLKNPKWMEMDSNKTEWFKKNWALLNDKSQEKGILFINGKQPYYGYKVIKNIISSTEKELTIVDPYIDNTVFAILEEVKKSAKIIILASKLQGDSKVMARKFKKERGNFEIYKTKQFHDRFIIVDKKCYAIGSSINNFGDKATTLFQISDDLVINKIKDLITTITKDAEVLTIES
jgi:hypothetical protein